MKLILTQAVEHLGSIGDVVDVKNGYGRNYLIPMGMGILANRGNQAELEHHQKILEKKRLKLVAHAEELAAKLKGLRLQFSKKVGATGKLFGTVTSREVARRLAELGYEVARKHIIVQGEVKALGEYDVLIELPQKVDVVITMEVVAEAQDVGQAQAEG